MSGPVTGSLPRVPGAGLMIGPATPAAVPAGPHVVACGGGHGLAATLTALRHVAERLTAVVTVADDGGSSGRLREELGVLPPGDLRMALAALCDDTEWGRTWAAVLQHRFVSAGPLDGHATGNLLISALWQQLGDDVAGLDLVASLLGARGRVLPMSSVPLVIEADVEAGAGAEDGEGGPGAGRTDGAVLVSGQAAVATTAGRVREVRLVPSRPPARAEAVAAVEGADWVVLGPGSWFTSVIPHLLVPDLARAITTTRARRALVMNLSAPRQESRGMTPADHLRALAAHAPDLALDVVLADPVVLRADGPDGEGRHGAGRDQVDDALLIDLVETAAALGAAVLLRPLASGEGAVHEPLRLASALRDAFDR